MLVEKHRFVVLDFEAERDCFGSLFPVEIGICMPGFRAVSSLIMPERDWVTGEQKVFNKSLYEDGLRIGRSTAQITAFVDAVAVDHIVLSDAAFVDRPLLGRLYQSARRELNVEVIEFFPTLFRLAENRGLVGAVINRWINEIDETRGEAHRADLDAQVRADLLHRVLSHV